MRSSLQNIIQRFQNKVLRTIAVSDSDQKLMIDHFRLISRKTIDFLFRLWNFDQSILNVLKISLAMTRNFLVAAPKK